MRLSLDEVRAWVESFSKYWRDFEKIRVSVETIGIFSLIFGLFLTFEANKLLQESNRLLQAQHRDERYNEMLERRTDLLSRLYNDSTPAQLKGEMFREFVQLDRRTKLWHIRQNLSEYKPFLADIIDLASDTYWTSVDESSIDESNVNWGLLFGRMPELRTHLNDISLRGTRLFRIDLSHLILTGVDFSCSDLRHAVLVGTNLAGAKLMGTKLDAARFQGGTSEGADFTAATLRGAHVVGTSVNNAIFDMAYVSDTVLESAGVPRSGERIFVQGIRDTWGIGKTPEELTRSPPNSGVNGLAVKRFREWAGEQPGSIVVKYSDSELPSLPLSNESKQLREQIGHWSSTTKDYLSRECPKRKG